MARASVGHGAGPNVSVITGDGMMKKYSGYRMGSDNRWKQTMGVAATSREAAVLNVGKWGEIIKESEGEKSHCMSWNTRHFHIVHLIFIGTGESI